MPAAAMGGFSPSMNNSKYSFAGSFDTAGGQRKYGIPFHQSPPGASQNMMGSWYNVPGGWQLDRVYGWYQVQQQHPANPVAPEVRASASATGGGCCGRQIVVQAPALDMAALTNPGLVSSFFRPFDSVRPGGDSRYFQGYATPQRQFIPAQGLGSIGDVLRDIFGKPSEATLPGNVVESEQSESMGRNIFKDVIVGVIVAIILGGLYYIWKKYVR